MDFYIDETVYTGSPEDMSGRLPREVRTYALLDTLGIPFTRVDHDATATIDACLEVEKILGIHICKNLFLCNAQKTRFYLLMMPGNKKFKTKNLSKQINSARLSFAGDEYMEQFLDITPGSVSILGLANDKENQVQLLIDSDVLKDPFLGKYVDKYFRGVNAVSTENRLRIMRLIENLTLGAAAVGYRTESMHGAGSPQAQRIMISRQGNLAMKKKLAKDIAKITE